MIVVASINNQGVWRGKAYCTTAKPMRGYPLLDFLAPTWEMVKRYKYADHDREVYIEAYRNLMVRRWAKVKMWLDSLDPNEDITILCYCREGAFCHRKLIASMIRKHRPDLQVVVH